MKKIIALSLLFSAFLCSELQAQFKFNVQAGLNINQAHLSNFYSLHKAVEPLLSYSAGFNVNYEINDYFALQSGLLFTQKGMRLNFDDNFYTLDGDITFRLNYIEIPLQGVFNIGKRFQVYGGPYLAFGIGGKQKDDYVYTSGPVSITHNSTHALEPTFDKVRELPDPTTIASCGCELWEAYNAIDYGMNMGVGYRFNNMLVRAGYSLGLQNVRIAQTETDNQEVYNRNFNLSVSYFLGK